MRRLQALSNTQVVCYDICPTPNCCVVFRKNLKELAACPKCGHHRYKENGEPWKKMQYMSIISWLQSLLRSRDYAKYSLLSHAQALT